MILKNTERCRFLYLVRMPNDVYVVSTEAHTEVLLPAIHDCILDVDTENRKMTVHLMDGLI